MTTSKPKENTSSVKNTQKSASKSKEASLEELRRQYAQAKAATDTDLLRKLDDIFTAIGEQPQVSSLSKALGKHTKKRRS